MFHTIATPARPAATGAWLLLAEVGHRTANEYTLAVSSLSLAATRTSDAGAKAALNHAVDRLLCYARAHRVLRAPDLAEYTDLGEYLERVGEALVRSILDERGITLTIASEPVEIEPERCWRAGMIVSELITNAARHAFAERGGAIWVDVTLVGDEIHCRVSDNGAPKRGGSRGRGSAIVDGLAAEIEGKVTRTFGDSGARVLLSLRRRAESETCAPR